MQWEFSAENQQARAAETWECSFGEGTGLHPAVFYAGVGST